MKKFYSFLFAAVALVGFAACNSDNTEEPAPAGVEKVSFKANIDDTKTGLDANNKTTWEVDDQVKIGDYTFTYDGTEFSCTDKGVTNLLGQTVTATYSKNGDGNIDSTAGTAGAVLVAENQVLEKENPTLNFAVTSAFLKFTTTDAVTLKGAGLFYYGGAAKDEITCENAGTYYVAINPEKNVELSYKVGTNTGKSAILDIEECHIYDLGTLEKVKADVRVMGSYNDVTDWSNGLQMYENYTDFLARNVKITGQFKLKSGNSWMSFTGDACNNYRVGTADDNMTVDEGTYDIYLNGYKNHMYLVPQTMSLIGDGISGGSWSTDTPIEFFEKERCWKGTFDLVNSKKFKLRAFNSWDMSWGTGANVNTGNTTLYGNGGDCTVGVESGTYEIKIGWDLNNITLTKVQ